MRCDDMWRTLLVLSLLAFDKLLRLFSYTMVDI